MVDTWSFKTLLIVKVVLRSYRKDRFKPRQLPLEPGNVRDVGVFYSEESKRRWAKNGILCASFVPPADNLFPLTSKSTKGSHTVTNIMANLQNSSARNAAVLFEKETSSMKVPSSFM